MYYIGLDNGGTTTKAAVYTDAGEELAICSKETRALCPRPGYVERDMEEMWEANCEVLRGAVEKSGISPSEVAALSICGHGKGLYLWGRDDKPARLGIISTDNRAYEKVNKWQSDGTEKKVFERAYQHIMACQPSALLSHIKETERDVYDNIKWVFEAKDYIRFRLTGEARGEVTDYSGSGLMNLKTKSYDRELLSLYGIEEIYEALPPLANSNEICGYVMRDAAEKCGLCEGTPVVGGMFDIDACALAVGVTDPKNVCMIAGTWSINEYPRKEAVIDGSVKMNSLFAIPEYYLIEESSPTSAGNNEWFINTLLPELKREAKERGESIFDIINREVESLPADEFCPVFLPFLMASNVHINAKASFVGLTASHTRAHIMRSVYEGIVFSHRYHYEKLLQSRDKKPDCIRLAGGAANSRVWTEMFADILSTPVETVSAGETGALGCAIAAYSAVNGVSIEESAHRMCKIGERVMPDLAKKEIYDRKYAMYIKVIEALDSVWDDMQKLC